MIKIDQNWDISDAPSSHCFVDLIRVLGQSDLCVYPGRPWSHIRLMKLPGSGQKVDFPHSACSKSVPKLSQFKWSKFGVLWGRDFEQNGSFFEFAAKRVEAILETNWLEHPTKFQPTRRPPRHLKMTSNGRSKCQHWAYLKDQKLSPPGKYFRRVIGRLAGRAGIFPKGKKLQHFISRLSQHRLARGSTATNFFHKTLSFFTILPP